ncbi:MAG TPA: hypothetical protein DHV28_17655 [Ignavibacteriales bacterium]|nr:hypothetical protein [Ignavibacteriales bacterium]
MAQFQEIGRYDIVVKKITERIYDALEAAGALVEGEAKLLCPVDLGNLESSINHKLVREENEVRIGTPVEYAPYVEFGTGENAENGQGRKGGWFFVSDRPQLAGWLKPLGTTKDGKYLYFTYGNKPHPFLRPALKNNIKNINRIFQEALRK